MESILERHWHHLPAREVLEILETSADEGLDAFESEDREKRFGPNLLPQRKPRGPIARFLLQFHQPLVYILLAAAILAAAVQEWVDAAVISGVVLANALIGFVQESRRSRDARPRHDTRQHGNGGTGREAAPRARQRARARRHRAAPTR